MRMAVACLLLLTACTSEPLQFADWTIPVPEGTPIIEYAAVPMEERTERIELVEDLVIGPQETSPCMFYRPTDVTVGPDGRVYVSDDRKHSVHVFSDGGDCLFTIGREGEGPGEFKQPRKLTIAGDFLVVSDGAKLSKWTLDGDHVADHTREPPEALLGLLGSDSEALVVHYDATPRVDSPIGVLSGYSTDGREMVQYATVARIAPEPFNSSTPLPIWVAQGSVNFESGPSLAFVVDSSGSVYFTRSDEYQLLRMLPSGETSWALRVAWPRATYNEKLIDRRLAHTRETYPEAMRSDIRWPDRQRALGSLRIDGHDHLFAFPIVDLPPGDNVGDKPVDVHSVDGERLFSGFITDLWDAAHGDFVYRLRLNDETEEHEIVRYRLVEPF